MRTWKGRARALRGERSAAERTGALALLTLSISLRVQAARAEPLRCAYGRATVEENVDPRFAPSIEQMCASLGTMPNVDPAATLRVLPAGADVIVEAVLADGRSALRRVTAPAELSLTAEALMALPAAPASSLSGGPGAPPNAGGQPSPLPVSAPAAADPHAVEESPRSPPLPGVQLRASRPTNSAPVPRSGMRIGVEIGAELMGRASGTPLYLSVSPSIYGGVRVDRWLFGLIARADAFEPQVNGSFPGFAMYGLGAGFLIAPRVVDAGDFHLDAGVSALFLDEVQRYQEGENDVSGSQSDIRLGLVARALLGHGPVRALLTLDGEISPIRLAGAPRIDQTLPPPPSFGGGFGAGASWIGP